MNRKTTLLAGVAAIGLAFGAAGALALNTQGGPGAPPAPRGPGEEPSPPAYNRWIQYGEFYVEPWDNRVLPPEAKARSPWFDPRWRVFNQCLEQGNVVVRSDRTQPFSQADMDELLKRVNAERPDRKANALIRTGDRVPGIAGVLLDCADKWFSRDPSAYAAQGVRDLLRGEIPEP